MDAKFYYTVSGFVIRHEPKNPDLNNSNLMVVGDEKFFLTFCFHLLIGFKINLEVLCKLKKSLPIPRVYLFKEDFLLLSI